MSRPAGGRRHLVSTIATASTCGRCGAALLVALDQGITARVEAQPIQPADEIHEIIAGKWTYTHAGRELIFRDADRIRHNQPPGPIHAQHVCPKETT